jgi:branched-chain amino acid transport system ATP-binding protein
VRVRDLEVVYGGVALALRGVSLDIPAGGICAVLGANGAGKTTLLRAITGLLPVHRGSITKGTVELDGERIDGLRAPAIVRRGVSQVMEGRRPFAGLTVEENLRAGAYVKGRDPATRDRMEHLYELFPVLAQRRQVHAGYLSGGEQQILVMARALVQDPQVLLLDEPWLGLAPRIAEQVRQVIVDVNASGTTVVLVEQHAAMALSIATTGYVLETGEVARAGPAEELRGDDGIADLYLGGGIGR